MSIFRIKIGKETRKGMETLCERFVGTKEEQYEVEKHFRKQYAGMAVSVEEIRNIEIGEKMKPNEEVDAVKEVGIYGNVKNYLARISNSKIEALKEYEKNRKELQEKIRENDEWLSRQIETQFKLKKISDMIAGNGFVSFAFHCTAFDFAKLSKIDEANESETDLPF